MTTLTNTHLLVPDVRNIWESKQFNHQYDAVVTAGPEREEVNWGHFNHIVESFEDTTNPGWGPELAQIERLVTFGAAQTGSVLVHCHAGISRSTATAWGITIAHGLPPAEGLARLMHKHPTEGRRTQRPFWPNRLIVEHLTDIFGDPEILDIYHDVIDDDWDAF